MARFSEIQKRLPLDSIVTQLTLAEVDAFRHKYQHLPEDYLAFLTEVGYGDLGELQLHGGPSRPECIYSPVPEQLEQIIIFGDDKQGYCFGFDRENGYRVVEISPLGEVDSGVESDFTSLMAAYFR